MTVDINKSRDRFRFLSARNDIRNQGFNRAHSRMKLGVRSKELSIQVITTKRCSIVANDHTIWVSHRDYLEDDSFPQFYGFWISCTSNKLQKALHDERGIGLTRMHS
jgi:hypothetical protein